jgi:hypothetical protein
MRRPNSKVDVRVIRRLSAIERGQEDVPHRKRQDRLTPYRLPPKAMLNHKDGIYITRRRDRKNVRIEVAILPREAGVGVRHPLVEFTKLCLHTNRVGHTHGPNLQIKQGQILR